MDLYIDGQQYFVQEKLGQGTHGSVFRIKQDKSEEQIALKIMQTKTNEIEALKALAGHKGFPKIITTFNENEYEWVAMTLCGLTLKDLRKVSPTYIFRLY
jgi:serine/threonine protein kinase